MKAYKVLSLVESVAPDIIEEKILLVVRVCRLTEFEERHGGGFHVLGAKFEVLQLGGPHAAPIVRATLRC